MLHLLLGTIGATWGWVRSVNTKEELASQVTVTTAALEEARTARDLANAEKRRAVRAAYLADMQAGHQALELDNLGLAKQVLARNRHFEAGFDPRHWEWSALWKRCQPDYERYFDVAVGSSMVVSPNGKWLATPSHIWEIDTAREVCSLDRLRTVDWVRFSPDGDLLYTADAHGTIRSWTLPELEPTSLELAHGAEISDAELSPDGRTLVVVSRKKVTVWDAVSGKLRKSVDVQGGERVAMSNDNSICAVSEGGTGQIHIHDLDSFERLRSISASGRWALEFSRDDKVIASSTGYTSPEVTLHRVSDGEYVDSLVGHSHSAVHVAYSPDGETLAVASHDQTVSLWTTRTNELIAKLRGHEARVDSVAFSVDGKRLFSGGSDGKICVWNIQNVNRKRWPLTRSKACRWDGWCRPQVSYSPDGRLVATTRWQPDAEEVPAGVDRTVWGFTIRPTTRHRRLKVR